MKNRRSSGADISNVGCVDGKIEDTNKHDGRNPRDIQSHFSVGFIHR